MGVERNPARHRVVCIIGLALTLTFVGCATKPAYLGELNGGRFYHSIAFSPDGRLLAAATTRETILFDVGSRKECARFRLDKKLKAGMPVALAYTADARLLAAHLSGKSTTVWEAGASNVVARVDLPDPPRVCALSPDGRWMAIATKDRPATIWELNTGRKLADLTNGPTIGVAFSRDGQWLATVGSDQGVYVCETASGRQASKVVSPQAPVRFVALAPGADRIAIAANDVNVLTLTNCEMRGVIASPSLSAGAKAAGVVWMLFSTLGTRPSGSAEVFATASAGRVEFSPSGTHLAMINSAANLDSALGHGGNQVRIFEVSTTQLVSTVAYNTDVHSIAFSPDGELIATAGATVEVWHWKQCGPIPVRPSPFPAVTVRFDTNITARSDSPLGRSAKAVRVGPFSDDRSQPALGERTAAFNTRMGDVFPARPVAESIRDAVAHLFEHPGQPTAQAPQVLRIGGTIRKCSVQTPVSLFRWKIEAEMELDLQVSNAAGALVHSALYRGQASKSTIVGPSEALIEQTCNGALQDLLQHIQDDPAWEKL